PLLGDSLRVLRALAGGALAGWPPQRVPPERRAELARAKADYVAAETENSDQAFGLVNLASFRFSEGDPAGAEAALRQAVEIEPNAASAYANLADLLRATDRDPEAEAVLRTGLARQPDAATLHHALGLW